VSLPEFLNALNKFISVEKLLKKVLSKKWQKNCHEKIGGNVK